MNKTIGTLIDPKKKAIILQRIRDGKVPLFMEKKPAPEKPMEAVIGGKKKNSRSAEDQRELNDRLVNMVNAAAVDKKIALGVALLIKRGADPNALCSDGSYVLTKAIFDKNVKTARALILGGAYINAQDGNENGGMTPLMLAAKEGLEDVCALLIAKGANIDARDGGGMTALMWAVQEDNEDICGLLVQKYADVRIQDEDGDTAVARVQSQNDKLRKYLARVLEKQMKIKP
jgi:ankyrin repeat protein